MNVLAGQYLSKCGGKYIWKGSSGSLETFMTSVGIHGRWQDIQHGRQFKGNRGTSFNWYHKNGTILIQGSSRDYLRQTFDESLRPSGVDETPIVHLVPSPSRNVSHNCVQGSDNNTQSRKRKADCISVGKIEHLELRDGTHKTAALRNYIQHKLSTWKEIVIADPHINMKGLVTVCQLAGERLNLLYTTKEALNKIQESLSPYGHKPLLDWIDEKVVALDSVAGVKFISGFHKFDRTQVIITDCHINDDLWQGDDCSHTVTTLDVLCYTFNVKWLSPLIKAEMREN